MTAHKTPSTPEGRLVYFRFPDPGKPTEVRGDFIHFFHPVPLQHGPLGDGHLEAALSIPPGVYAYKFRTQDGAWHLDPDNPRTRSCDGLRNSLLSIGGADEPILHAPVRPFVFLRDDGQLCVRAGLRRGGSGSDAPPLLRWHEAQRADTRMRLLGQEDEHLLYEALLPVSQRAIEYVFVLGSGRVVGAAGAAGQAFRVVLRDTAIGTPQWWRDAVVYTIFVDRFRRGAEGSWSPPPTGRLPQAGLPPMYALPPEQARRGGDLWGVLAALPYLQDLGVTVLHLTPVGLAPSAHRYDAVDPRQVDPELGGEPALRAVLDEAHRLGLRVLVDLGLTHVHRDFFAFLDVRQRGAASPYHGWFQVRRHPFKDGPSPGYEHYQKGQWYEPLLNLDSDEVAEYLEATVRRFVALGADGLRVDQAAEVPLKLLLRLRRAARAERPDAVLLGEVVPDNGFRYTAAALDAATDFTVADGLRRWIGDGQGGGDARLLAQAHGRRAFWRGGPGWTALGFTATHDQQRLRSLAGDGRLALLGHLLVLTRPEVPAILYGDEVGLHSPGPARDFEDSWPDRLVMPWDRASWEAETLDFFRRAIALRRESAALRYGDEVPLQQADPHLLAFRRQAGEEIIEVYVHRGGGRAAAALGAGAPSGATVLLALGEVAVQDGQVLLGERSGVVLRRHQAAEAQALWGQVAAHNRALSDLAWAQGRLVTPSLPSHLYLTVTEACNLRCRHCITEAPARTAQGRARVMQRWVLDALDQAFGAADYFGFAHGGESLVAPIFWDVLARIRRARAGRPYDVHLLTNGMLLRPEVTRELIGLGVTSLAVSLDGAGAATNDEIRLGARFETIVEHVRQAVLLRRELGADLRVGISTVVTADNVAELAALGRLAAALEVDWIKVEELFPVNGFCRLRLIDHRGASRLAIDPRESPVLAPMAALRAELAGRPIVVVDHLEPPGGCPCDAEQDPVLRQFREADDYANRARFRPCSMAWEQACIDPDGAVHPVDYHHPAVGSLSQAPLVDLWNGVAMQRLRTQVLRRWPVEQRQRCPRHPAR